MATLYAVNSPASWATPASWSTIAAQDASRIGNGTVPTALDDVILDSWSGSISIGSPATCKSLDCTGYTGTLTHNAFNLTVSGNVTLVSGMTYTPNAGGVLLFNANSTLTTGGKLVYTIFITTASTVILGDNLGFIVNKTCTLGIGSTSTLNLNGKTVSGNSSINRLLFNASTIGSPTTILVNGGTFANADFQDINFNNGGSNLDLSSITGNSGDCGGNGMTGGGTLTFTTAVDQHWINDLTGNWSDATKWTSRVPLAQDNVFFDRSFSNRTITMDMPRAGKTIDFSGASGTVTWATSVATSIYGSIDLTNLTTMGAIPITFAGRSLYTIKSNGKIFGTTNISAPTGTYTLLDSYTSTPSNLQVNNGTFIDNGYTITANSIYTSGTTSTRAVTKTGNWVITRTTTGQGFANIATNLTWSDTVGTITFIGQPIAGATISFVGAGLNYNNIAYNSLLSSGYFTIVDSNTFKQISVFAPNLITLTAGTTTTITNNFQALGSAGKMVIINSPAQTTSLATPILKYTGKNIINLNFIQIQGVNVLPQWNNYGKGLDFKGQASSGDYVSVPNSASGNQIFGATSFSAECWLLPRTAGATSLGRMFDHGGAATVGVLFYVQYLPLQLSVSIYEGATLKQTLSSTTLILNTINHVAFSWTSGSSPKLYINGAEVSYSIQTSVITPDNDSGQLLYIGNRKARDRTFDGIIYSTRLYRNVALTAGNVSTLYAAGVKGINPLGNATAEYLFKDTPSGSILTDSISGNNGSIVGANWANGLNAKWNWGKTERGSGLDFKGQASSGDYVSAPNSATANQIYGATSFSAECWFNARSTTINNVLLRKYRSSIGYSCRVISGQIISAFISEGGVLKSSISTTTFTLNTLNHLVYTWTTGSAIKIYINGIEVGYSTSTAITTPDDDTALSLCLGNDLDAKTVTFDGIIYSTRIYRNKALSAAEVLTAYQAGAKALLPVSGCTSQYMFNEGSSTTLTDSVNAVNGTIVGAGWTNNWKNKVGLNFRGQATGGDAVSVANSATVNQFFGSTSYSVDGWLYTRSGGAVSGRFINKTNAINGFFINYVGAGQLYTSGGIYNLSPPTGIFAFNTLVHIVMVWDGSQITSYVNGIAGTPVATTGTATDESLGSLNIGNAGLIRTFDGNILATRIYRNKALSLAEVQTAYYAGPNAVSPVSGVTQEFLFNEGSGNVLTDSVSGNNGTISGAVWSNIGFKSGTGQYPSALQISGD